VFVCGFQDSLLLRLCLQLRLCSVQFNVYVFIILLEQNFGLPFVGGGVNIYTNNILCLESHLLISLSTRN